MKRYKLAEKISLLAIAAALFSGDVSTTKTYSADYKEIFEITEMKTNKTGKDVFLYTGNSDDPQTIADLFNKWDEENSDLCQTVNSKSVMTGNDQKKYVKAHCKKAAHHLKKLPAEYKALLDTIAWAEGTDFRQYGQNHSYNMYVCGSRFNDLSDHPYSTGEKGIVCNSSAAGRYQIMRYTYAELKKKGVMNNFSPRHQDRGAVYLFEKKRGVNLQRLKTAKNTGNFKEIWNDLAPEWASLPNCKRKKCSSYYSGQHTRPPQQVTEFYLNRLTYWNNH